MSDITIRQLAKGLENSFQANTELREQLKRHLRLAVKALQAIEASGISDNPPAVEEKAIRDVLGITRVDFRLLGGEVIAYFIDEIERDGLVNSYMHVGQHCSASYPNDSTQPAAPHQYGRLKSELEQSPYNYKFEIIDPQDE